MARKLLPPYFTGSTDSCTCYRMHGTYYVRSKSSLTAERVKTDPCFTPTMAQAGIMARASKLGAAAYKLIPLFCREFSQYRMLTGKANLMLKKGLEEEKISATLVNKYVKCIIRQAKEKGRRIVKTKRVKIKRAQKPLYLRKYRRLRIVQWSIGDGNPALDAIAAVDSMLEKLLARSFQPVDNTSEDENFMCTAP